MQSRELSQQFIKIRQNKGFFTVVSELTLYVTFLMDNIFGNGDIFYIAMT